MNILGFVYGFRCHDTAAAIVCDGRLVAAAEEERFTRQKHDSAFPARSIDYCLKCTGLSMDQVDLIAFPEKPYRSGRDSYLAEMSWNSLLQLRAGMGTSFKSLLHKGLLDVLLPLGFRWNWQMQPAEAEGFAQLKNIYPKLPPVRFYDHHRAHAAAAYLTSGRDAAAIVTMDFAGGPYSTAVWKGKMSSIGRLETEVWLNSLGEFYWDATKYLGLGDFAEGKTMGLAPYGNGKKFETLFETILERKGSHWFNYCGWPSETTLGFPARSDESPLDAPFPDLAAAIQMALESAQQRIIRSAVDRANNRMVCLGGGVGLNCSANGALLQSGLVDSAWVFPAANDAGLSVGAALLCSAECGELQAQQLEHAYWGPEFSLSECEAAILQESRVTFRRIDGPLNEEIAEALAAGQVVGVCRGRMEFGPRALGNRSILADPRRLEIRDRVNRLKGRELWRPLAPAVLAERASEFFDLRQPSPFMLFRAQIRPEKRSMVPAIVHVDGSARPQTVTSTQNPAFYDLISAFSRRSGVPMLLNTSFNTAKEPIVCTPQDAIASFLAIDLDLLVLEDFLVENVKANQLPAQENSSPL
jgi:carbamoyltransferase